MNANTLSRLAMIIAAATVIATGAPATAQTPPGPQPGGTQPGGAEHHGPPPEAIAACKSSKLSQACSFTSPKGAESGTCWQPDASHPLACRPDRNKANAGNSAAGNGAAGNEAAGNGAANDASAQRQGPPAESLAACKGRKLGDACSFTSAKGAESGACFQPDAGHPLACRPAAPR